MATYFCILAWEIPWTEEPAGYIVLGVARVGHNLATKPPPNTLLTRPPGTPMIFDKNILTYGVFLVG